MASNLLHADAPLPDSSLNLARWCLERHAEDPAQRDAPALTFARRDGSKQRWTYAEAWGRVQRLARGLLAGGLEPGDRVLIRLSPSPDTAFAFFGATLAGLVAVPAGPPFSAEMSAHLADEVGALVLVTTWELRFEGFDGATLLTGDLDLLDGPGPLPATSADDDAFRIYRDSLDIAGGLDATLPHRVIEERPQIDEPVHDRPTDITPDGTAPHWPYTSGVGLIDVWAAGGHALLHEDASYGIP